MGFNRRIEEIFFQEGKREKIGGDKRDSVIRYKRL